MQKIITLITLSVLVSSVFVSTADARTRTRTQPQGGPVYVTSSVARTTTPTNYTSYNYNSQTGQGYYYSQYYQPGFTYASTPTPGYYWYFSNQGSAYTQVNTYPYNSYYNTYGSNQNIYYTPQNYVGAPTTTQTYNQGQYYYPNQYPYTRTAASYPGCNKANIIIGGQEWSACNATDRRVSSSDQSGWFFAGDTQSTFLSYNGMGNSLAWQGKQTQSQSYNQGACADGYRLPTRGEWETAIFYARQNSTTLASLLGLSYNGGFYGYRDSSGNVTLSARTDVNGAYWTSTVESGTPIVLHLASGYAGYRTDGTDYARQDRSYNWQYSDTGLRLIQSNYSEIANVRCIKNS